jgi:aerobic-type carbon monoxide dehydrogenase small subunit (CoxS/CutS family)
MVHGTSRPGTQQAAQQPNVAVSHICRCGTYARIRTAIRAAAA